MLVIPAINRENFEEAEEQIKLAVKILPSDEKWISIDVSDGRFSSRATWSDSQKLWILLKENKNLRDINFEIDLMVIDPEPRIKDWFIAGAKRISAPAETLFNPDYFLETAEKFEGQAMISISPGTPIENLSNILRKFSYFHVFAVEPGLAGQKFLPAALEKIKFLRQNFQNAIIEVDGGITPETIKLAKEAGADIFTATSYIFENPDPEAAYAELEQAAGS
jgi:ribulose-phosphate 3-epimerase